MMLSRIACLKSLKQKEIEESSEQAGSLFDVYRHQVNLPVRCLIVVKVCYGSDEAWINFFTAKIFSTKWLALLDLQAIRKNFSNFLREIGKAGMGFA
ncbi:MAG: hypothetical protein ACRDBM_07455 [Sporomusa sp.]